MEGERAAVRVAVTGRVQGVSFRAWVRDEARRRGLAGWVRNEMDGSVAALIVGPESRVAEMVAALWRGPPGAAVSKVAPEPAAPDDAGAGFEYPLVTAAPGYSSTSLAP